jgi:hypothetical protein
VRRERIEGKGGGEGQGVCFVAACEEKGEEVWEWGWFMGLLYMIIKL